MLQILSNRTYRHLFAAQVVALLGSGLATIALGLMAYDLAGGNAAMVLGTVFTLKMVAYVGLAPLAGAYADRLPRRQLLVGLDLVRVAVALCLPFVSAVWQIYALLFILHAASAAFTPTFQATIPDVLPEEEDYTRALSLSRLAYDLENILSPTLAALLLMVLASEQLFWGTALGFAASTLLVMSTILPKPKPAKRAGVWDRTTRGTRIYLQTPRLRGLLALCFVASAAGSMVLVNTVVLVRGELGLGEPALAWAMGVFGAGSMLAAFTLPRLLDHFPDRAVMTTGATLMIAALLGLAAGFVTVGANWPMLLGAWALMGLGYSAVLTPSGRLLRRSSHSEDRTALFAAQFALSHLCWLAAYPAAGWLMTRLGPLEALIGLSLLATAGLIAALRLWPEADPVELMHSHPELPRDHPHLKGAHEHRHAYVIDSLHPHWPTER